MGAFDRIIMDRILSMHYPICPVRSTRYFQMHKSKIRRNIDSRRLGPVKDKEEVVAVDSIKDKYLIEAVAMEEVPMVEEDVVDIRITPTTPWTVLTSKIVSVFQQCRLG